MTVKTLLLIIVTLLSSCSQSSKCIGPTGQFIASPFLSINSCFNVRPVTLQELEITQENSLYRTCGWHILEEQQVTTEFNCTQTVTKSLNTLQDYYYGFIVIDYICLESRCKTVWELEFKELPKNIEEY